LDAETLYKEGKLTDAIASLNTEVRDRPGDVQRRTFLFELLCFAGEYDRASKQLKVLSRDNPDTTMGVLAFERVLECEAERGEMFAKGRFAESVVEPRPVRGRLNGRPFERLEDGDPRIGARLEVFLGGQYSWIPLEHLAFVRLEPPRQLRDLLWSPAHLQGGVGLGGVDLGEALLPILTPAAWADPDELVRLGRVTKWIELADGQEAPVGQKMLLVDGEDFPLLELRELDIEGGSAPPSD
jgi:type VI secretion system protein ImpE